MDLVRRRAPWVVALLLGSAAASAACAEEPSSAYQASLRRTLEREKQRRRARGDRPVGKLVPYPLPPSLIIRQTPEVHDEVRDFLRLLRRL
ncbi:MAG: hypothetical protein IRY99_17340 [Isosphaeraceae bacterium]|nr:hypothetical protein [Isosphaeraceae bacterium]